LQAIRIADFRRVPQSMSKTYAIRVIGLCGTVLNTLLALLLFSRHLQHSIYNFLWARTVFNLILSLLVTTYAGSCLTCEFKSNHFGAYGYYISQVPLRVALLASLISDVLLILNRFFEIVSFRKKHLIADLSKKCIFIVCLAPPALISVPFYFSVNVVQTGNASDSFVMQLTEIGASQFFYFYNIALFFVETVAPVVALTVLNLISVYKFRKLMANKKLLTVDRGGTRHAEIKFTLMVFILTSICILAHVFDLVVVVIHRMWILEPSLSSRKPWELIVFVREYANIFLYVVHALDGLVYLKMDKNLWSLILKMFRRRVTLLLDCRFFCV